MLVQQKVVVCHAAAALHLADARQSDKALGRGEHALITVGVWQQDAMLRRDPEIGHREARPKGVGLDQDGFVPIFSRAPAQLCVRGPDHRSVTVIDRAHQVTLGQVFNRNWPARCVDQCAIGETDDTGVLGVEKRIVAGRT